MDEKKTSDTANTRLGIVLAQRSEVLGLGSGKKANKNAGSRLGMTNRLDNPNVNKV